MSEETDYLLGRIRVLEAAVALLLEKDFSRTKHSFLSSDLKNKVNYMGYVDVARIHASKQSNNESQQGANEGAKNIEKALAVFLARRKARK